MKIKYPEETTQTCQIAPTDDIIRLRPCQNTWRLRRKMEAGIHMSVFNRKLISEPIKPGTVLETNYLFFLCVYATEEAPVWRETRLACVLLFYILLCLYPSWFYACNKISFIKRNISRAFFAPYPHQRNYPGKRVAAYLLPLGEWIFISHKLYMYSSLTLFYFLLEGLIPSPEERCGADRVAF